MRALRLVASVNEWELTFPGGGAFCGKCRHRILWGQRRQVTQPVGKPMLVKGLRWKTH